MKENNSDDRFEKVFDELLDQPIPEADQNMKNMGINAAIAAFSKEYSQGTAGAARPIGNRDTDQTVTWLSRITKPIRSLLMNIPNHRMAYNALATAAIAFVAVSLVFVMPSMQTKTRVEDFAGVFSDTPANNGAVIAPVTEGPVIGSPVVQTTGNEDAHGRSEQETAIPTRIEAIVEQSPDAAQRDNRAELDEIIVSKEKVTAAVPQKPTASAKELAKSLPVTPTVEEIPVTREFESVLPDAETGRNRNQSRQQAAGDTAVRMQVTAMQPKLVEAKKGNAPLLGQSYSAPADGNISTPSPRFDEREEYAEYQANPIRLVADEPVSTFSIDVDTASYSLVRNQLNSGYLPKPQAVRAEELINYFDYDYPAPKTSKQPFESSISVFDSPWNKDKKLLHIGIKGYAIPADETPDSNLVFLLDVSGSMNSANKLPLVKQSVGLLLETLKPSDTVSIVVYAGAAGTVLEPTLVKDKSKILGALQRLDAGGSTAGGAGIKLAYQLAEQSFNKNSVNRIILATDGDFNVGQQSNEDLKTLVERKRDNGVFLSVLGFGRNNYQDDMMQTLAQNGNGVAAYIDTLSEAKKVLVDEATSTLFPIAKDVKIQVEFNPASVSEYRLVGYETRHLNRQDFNNDKVDAGDIGAGHTVTAIYEITPANASGKSVDQLRYSQNTQETVAADRSSEYGFLKIRYKLPNSSNSRLIEKPILKDTGQATGEAQFSAAVAGFAQLLAGSNYTGELNYDQVIALASQHKGVDSFGYRSEFIQLVRMAKIAQP